MSTKQPWYIEENVVFKEMMQVKSIKSRSRVMVITRDITCMASGNCVLYTLCDGTKFHGSKGNHRLGDLVEYEIFMGYTVAETVEEQNGL